jgi:nitroreductase
MDLYDVMRSTGSTRDFLPEPVPDDVLDRILDNARFAGSGGNRQPWHVVVVRDPELRRRIRDLNQPVWNTYIAARERGEVPFAPGWTEPDEPAPHVPLSWLEKFESVPVVLVVCARLGALAVTDQALARQSIVAGASRAGSGTRPPARSTRRPS